MSPFAALLAVVLAWGLVSQRLALYSITLPIVLVAIGAVLSATHVVVVELDTESVRTLVGWRFRSCCSPMQPRSPRGGCAALDGCRCGCSPSGSR